MLDIGGLDTSVTSVLGENKGFVGCRASWNVAVLARTGRDLLLETEKLCQVTSQVTDQKPVSSYLQVVNSGVLAAR